MMYGYIYIVFDHLENKIYVGQHKLNRNKTYFGSGTIIKRVFKKRPDLLEKRILGYCETKEELDEAEKECIIFFEARNPIYGYNITEGGGGFSSNHSLESRKKISQQTIGNKNPMFGKIHSDSTKQKISESLSGINHPHFGKSRSLKTKNKISQSHKGKIKSKEHLLHISQSLKGRKLSEETKQKIKDAWVIRKQNDKNIHAEHSL